MNAILNVIVKLFIRIFMPGIARSLEEEGQFDFRDKVPGRDETDVSLYIDVEDNGAGVTLVCFAGMAVLYAAMPKFEFRKTLMTGRDGYNFVWVRDIHRASYYLAPDGSPNGFAFYTRIIGDALERLGSAHNIAIGASGGVFGLLLAYALMFPHRKVVPLIPPIPMPAWLFATLYAGVELFLGVTGSLSGVAHFAHLGGMIGSGLTVMQWRRARGVR